MLWVICFELFLCLPFVLWALPVFTLRWHDPDSENSASREFMTNSATLLYLACSKLILLNWWMSARIVLVSKLASYPTPGTLSNTPWSALPPTYTISVASAALQHLASFVFGRLWLHWSQDLCFGRSVHVRDNYPSGQLTHQIAHIWAIYNPANHAWRCHQLATHTQLWNLTGMNCFIALSWFNLTIRVFISY